MVEHRSKVKNGTEAAPAGIVAEAGVSEAIAERKTVGELKTALFDTFDNRYRDWQRVAHTEINTAVQQGVYDEIQTRSDAGANQLVFKRPNPDACPHCKRVYLKDDGITPKVFKLSDLEQTNVGRKAKDWGPTIGSVHPWCNCQLSMVPDGYDFVKKRVVTDPFKRGKRQYKRGQVVEQGTYDDFSQAQKSNSPEKIQQPSLHLTLLLIKK